MTPPVLVCAPPPCRHRPSSVSVTQPQGILRLIIHFRMQHSIRASSVAVFLLVDRQSQLVVFSATAPRGRWSHLHSKQIEAVACQLAFPTVRRIIFLSAQYKGPCGQNSLILLIILHICVCGRHAREKCNCNILSFLHSSVSMKSQKYKNEIIAL